MSLVVIGAGGHALVVLDAALSGSLPVAGLVDQVVPAGQMIGAVQVLGDDTLFQDPSFVQAHPFHLSMSNPAVKQRLAESLQAHSTTIVSIIHPTAIVSLSAAIEAGVFINAGADVNAGAQIGSHAIVNTRASIDHGCRIGAAASSSRFAAATVSMSSFVMSVEQGRQIVVSRNRRAPSPFMRRACLWGGRSPSGIQAGRAPICRATSARMIGSAPDVYISGSSDRIDIQQLLSA